MAHHGAGERFRPIDDPAARAAVRARYGISDDYLLYVGKIQARKNLVRLLEAFDRVVRARGGSRIGSRWWGGARGYRTRLSTPYDGCRRATAW